MRKKLFKKTLAMVLVLSIFASLGGVVALGADSPYASSNPSAIFGVDPDEGTVNAGYIIGTCVLSQSKFNTANIMRASTTIKGDEFEIWYFNGKSWRNALTSMTVSATPPATFQLVDAYNTVRPNENGVIVGALPTTGGGGGSSLPGDVTIPPDSGLTYDSKTSTLFWEIKPGSSTTLTAVNGYTLVGTPVGVTQTDDGITITTSAIDGDETAFRVKKGNDTIVVFVTIERDPAPTPVVAATTDKREYVAGQTASVLTATVTYTDTTVVANNQQLTYQWYKANGTTANLAEDTKVSAQAAYTPTIAATLTVEKTTENYYCVVTNKGPAGGAYAATTGTSAIVSITTHKANTITVPEGTALSWQTGDKVDVQLGVLVGTATAWTTPWPAPSPAPSAPPLSDLGLQVTNTGVLKTVNDTTGVTNKPGSYTYTFSATTSSGQVSAPLTLTVTRSDEDLVKDAAKIILAAQTNNASNTNVTLDKVNLSGGDGNTDIPTRGTAVVTKLKELLKAGTTGSNAVAGFSDSEVQTLTLTTGGNNATLRQSTTSEAPGQNLDGRQWTLTLKTPATTAEQQKTIFITVTQFWDQDYNDLVTVWNSVTPSSPSPDKITDALKGKTYYITGNANVTPAPTPSIPPSAAGTTGATGVITGTPSTTYTAGNDAQLAAILPLVWQQFGRAATDTSAPTSYTTTAGTAIPSGVTLTITNRQTTTTTTPPPPTTTTTWNVTLSKNDAKLVKTFSANIAAPATSPSPNTNLSFYDYSELAIKAAHTALVTTSQNPLPTSGAQVPKKTDQTQAQALEEAVYNSILAALSKTSGSPAVDDYGGTFNTIERVKAKFQVHAYAGTSGTGNTRTYPSNNSNNSNNGSAIAVGGSGPSATYPAAGTILGADYTGAWLVAVNVKRADNTFVVGGGTTESAALWFVYDGVSFVDYDSQLLDRVTAALNVTNNAVTVTNIPVSTQPGNAADAKTAIEAYVKDKSGLSTDDNARLLVTAAPGTGVTTTGAWTITLHVNGNNYVQRVFTLTVSAFALDPASQIKTVRDAITKTTYNRVVSTTPSGANDTNAVALAKQVAADVADALSTPANGNTPAVVVTPTGDGENIVNGVTITADKVTPYTPPSNAPNTQTQWTITLTVGTGTNATTDKTKKVTVDSFVTQADFDVLAAVDWIGSESSPVKTIASVGYTTTDTTDNKAAQVALAVAQAYAAALSTTEKAYTAGLGTGTDAAKASVTSGTGNDEKTLVSITAATTSDATSSIPYTITVSPATGTAPTGNTANVTVTKFIDSAYQLLKDASAAITNAYNALDAGAMTGTKKLPVSGATITTGTSAERKEALIGKTENGMLTFGGWVKEVLDAALSKDHGVTAALMENDSGQEVLPNGNPADWVLVLSYGGKTTGTPDAGNADRPPNVTLKLEFVGATQYWLDTTVLKKIGTDKVQVVTSDDINDAVNGKANRIKAVSAAVKALLEGSGYAAGKPDKASVSVDADETTAPTANAGGTYEVYVTGQRSGKDEGSTEFTLVNINILTPLGEAKDIVTSYATTAKPLTIYVDGGAGAIPSVRATALESKINQLLANPDVSTWVATGTENAPNSAVVSTVVIRGTSAWRVTFKFGEDPNAQTDYVDIPIANVTFSGSRLEELQAYTKLLLPTQEIKVGNVNATDATQWLEVTPTIVTAGGVTTTTENAYTITIGKDAPVGSIKLNVVKYTVAYDGSNGVFVIVFPSLFGQTLYGYSPVSDEASAEVIKNDDAGGTDKITFNNIADTGLNRVLWFSQPNTIGNNATVGTASTYYQKIQYVNASGVTETFTLVIYKSAFSIAAS